MEIEFFFFFLWGKKTTKRAGWVRRDVKDPESIADHMYRMGLMALIASDIPGVDRDKLAFHSFYFLFFPFNYNLKKKKNSNGRCFMRVRVREYLILCQ